MAHRQRSTPGRRSRLVGLGLVAALVWPVVVADAALAIHNRSRAFSIVDPGRPVPGATDSFTCRLIEFEEAGTPDADYDCADPAAGFSARLTGSATGAAEPLLAASSTADQERTRVRSPAEFTCDHTGGTSRLPRDFACEDDRGREFTLQDFAYVNPVVDGTVQSAVEYALPCRPCVAIQE
ncbi:hypothetical protein [Geodermatophilus sp. SYSU D01105]